MSFCLNFPLFLILLSLIFSVLSAVLRTRTARTLSLVLTALSAAANTYLFGYLAGAGQSFTYQMGHFPRPWGNELVLSPLPAFFSAFFSLVFFLCLLGGEHKPEERIEGTGALPNGPGNPKIAPSERGAKGKARFFYVCADLVQVSLLVLAYSNDIFTGYVFIEICTLASCGLLMIRQSGKAILASVRYMIFSLIGSGLFLFGLIFLYDITGHLLMPNLRESVALLWASGSYRMPLLAALVMMCVGLAVKSGLFPFHLWMADTYGAALPTASGILSGLVSKGYIFFLLKLIFEVFGTRVFYESGLPVLFFVLGAAGIILGSVGALQENNLFRMLAYSSAAQIGYIYLGIGLSPELGMQACLFQILAHAVTKPALFLAAERLSEACGGAVRFRELQGVGHRAPLAGAFFTFHALSMIGVPLTVGFMAKYQFGVAAFGAAGTEKVRMIATLLILAVSTVLNTLYFARTIIRIYNKEPGRAAGHTAQEAAGHAVQEKAPDASPRRLGPALSGFATSGLFYILLSLLFGVLSSPFLTLLSEGLTLF